VPTHADDPRIDDTARGELHAEAESHRRALEGLSPRDTEAVVAEVNRHLDRVIEIMRDLVARAALRAV
jgi:DNA-binding GntR family transcriptional regulator